MIKNEISLKRTRGALDLEQFAGEWIALIENKIVGHNKALKVLMRTVKNRSLKKKPSVLLVPRKEEGPYILIL